MMLTIPTEIVTLRILKSQTRFVFSGKYSLLGVKRLSKVSEQIFLYSGMYSFHF
jgi:hypothetical protein